MQEQLEAEQESQKKLEQLQTAENQENLSCHICSQRFHDKRVLSKHLRMHEQQKQSENSFSNSALAAMLADTNISTDENTTEYSYPTYKGQMVENGEFACDMCPKKFSHVNALKVHRGWHFRSSDGRQITDSNNIWRPDMNSHNRNKRTRAANPPVCPFCKSTFASGNNLRRHIVEVHKRNEAKLMRENGAATDTTFIEKELECQACGITFSSRPEWVEHKISHARTMKPSKTYEWGCEICGKVFTRKERLLVHMTSHMSGKEEDVAQNSKMEGFESNSQSSMSSHSLSYQSKPQQSMESTLKSTLQKSTNEKPTISLLQPSLLKQPIKVDQQQQQNQSFDEDNDIKPKVRFDIDNDDSDSKDAIDEQSHSCVICQEYFTSAKDLKEHIKSHIESSVSASQNEDEFESNADDSQFDEDDDGENEQDMEDAEEVEADASDLENDDEQFVE